ncbi:MAG: ribonuclease HI [Pseudomonadota bacterium]|nr:ribonuclease HI [Pseudomonadota bacterium]
MSESATRVEVFTDGACSGNPGPGGWAALMRCGAHEKWLTGAELATTNNRMELTAAIRALQSLKRRSTVCITTDSRYVQQGASEWLPAWKARGWRNAAREPVANQDLWQEMDLALAQHDVELKWVRGHEGHVENEACDQRARAAIAQLLSART